MSHHYLADVFVHDLVSHSVFAYCCIFGYTARHVVETFKEAQHEWMLRRGALADWLRAKLKKPLGTPPAGSLHPRFLLALEPSAVVPTHTIEGDRVSLFGGGICEEEEEEKKERDAEHRRALTALASRMKCSEEELTQSIFQALDLSGIRGPAGGTLRYLASTAVQPLREGNGVSDAEGATVAAPNQCKRAATAVRKGLSTGA